MHFLGWSSRWDEWVEASERIQPAHTKVGGCLYLCWVRVVLVSYTPRDHTPHTTHNMSTNVHPNVHQQVRNWRPNLQVGDPVEVRSAMYQVRVFHSRWILVCVCFVSGPIYVCECIRTSVRASF